MAMIDPVVVYASDRSPALRRAMSLVSPKHKLGPTVVVSPKSKYENIVKKLGDKSFDDSVNRSLTHVTSIRDLTQSVAPNPVRHESSKEFLRMTKKLLYSKQGKHLSKGPKRHSSERSDERFEDLVSSHLDASFHHQNEHANPEELVQNRRQAAVITRLATASAAGPMMAKIHSPRQALLRQTTMGSTTTLQSFDSIPRVSEDLPPSTRVVSGLPQSTPPHNHAQRHARRMVYSSSAPDISRGDYRFEFVHAPGRRKKTRAEVSMEEKIRLYKSNAQAMSRLNLLARTSNASAAQISVVTSLLKSHLHELQATRSTSAKTHTAKNTAQLVMNAFRSLHRGRTLAGELEEEARDAEQQHAEMDENNDISKPIIRAAVEANGQDQARVLAPSASLPVVSAHHITGNMASRRKMRDAVDLDSMNFSSFISNDIHDSTAVAMVKARARGLDRHTDAQGSLDEQQLLFRARRQQPGDYEPYMRELEQQLAMGDRSPERGNFLGRLPSLQKVATSLARRVSKSPAVLTSPPPAPLGIEKRESSARTPMLAVKGQLGKNMRASPAVSLQSTGEVGGDGSMNEGESRAPRRPSRTQK